MTLPVLATTLVLIYTLACWVRPFGRCRRCRGTGACRRLITRRLTTCRRCRGSGLRLRYGRRAANYLTRVQHEGHRTRRTR